MANEQNLKPCRTKEEARERGRAGGKKSVESRRARKTLREELTALLEIGETQNRVSTALIDKAMNGDVKAFETIRDTIGEKPTEKQEIEYGENTLKALSPKDKMEELQNILAEFKPGGSD